MRVMARKSISGQAIATVTNKDNFSLKVTVKTAEKTTEEKTFQFNVSALPKGFVIKNGRKYFVNISPEGDKIDGIRPLSGFFPVEYKEIFKGGNESGFFVLEKTGTYGTSFSFIVTLVISKGENKGAEIPLYLPLTSSSGKLWFDNDDGYFGLTGEPEKSAPLAQLMSFFDAANIPERIKFPSDFEFQSILHVFSLYFSKYAQPFNVLLENGYVSNILRQDDILDEGLEDDEIFPDITMEDEAEETPTRRISLDDI